MYGSQAMSKDLNLPFPASPFRLGKDEIDLSHQSNHGHGHLQQDQQQQQMGSGGLLRYRSAPNSVLGDLCEEFLPNRAPAPEEEPMYARFMAPDLRDLLGDKQGVSAAAPVPPSEVAPPHMLFQLHHHHQQQQVQQPQPTLGNISCSTTVAATAAENLFHPIGSIGMEPPQQHSKGGGGGSTLIRHSSSPAGLFSHLTVDNGFASMRAAAAAAADSSGSGSTSTRLKGHHQQLGFSPRQGTTSTFMSQISEMGSDGLGGSPDGEDGSCSRSAAVARCYLPGYPVASWDDTASVLLADGLQGGRRARDPSELQNGEMRGHPHLGGGLAHHLSLPVPSRATDMASVERFLQFQDAVPCKLRAKRGCATHPRSIAERVRRTRISERMRKLQELVPNMDKQTNTADMLDLAVEYIKELERQAKALSETRAKCTCSASGQRNNHQDY